MVSYGLFFGSLIVLYLLSHVLTKLLSQILYFHTRSQHFTIYFTAFVFFPGVVIHELSHAFAAIVTGVRVSHMEFLPKIIDGRLKLGSVSLSQTDPFRRTWIGVAPVLGGCAAILGAMFLYREFFLGSYIALFLTGLFVYQVSNTMFSSRKDIEGTGIFFVFFIVTLFVLWIVGVPVATFFLTSDIGVLFQHLFMRGSYYLGVAIGIDLFVLSILGIIKRLSRI